MNWLHHTHALLAGLRVPDHPAEHRASGLGTPEYRFTRDVDQVLAAELKRHLTPGRSLVAVDVGAGSRPYARLLTTYARVHVGVDPVVHHHTGAVVRALAEWLPLLKNSVDFILCTQTLEHVDDPMAAIEEFHRVLTPAGLLFLSTHGTYVYHPTPADYWRFTHQGLQRLLERAGFTIENITGCGGGAVVAAFYLANLLHGTFTDKRVRPFVKLLTAVINRSADHLDPTPRRVYAKGADLTVGFGEIAVNYVVVARKPS